MQQGVFQFYNLSHACTCNLMTRRNNKFFDAVVSHFPDDTHTGFQDATQLIKILLMGPNINVSYCRTRYLLLSIHMFTRTVHFILTLSPP